MKVTFSRDAATYLSRLDVPTKRRIKQGILDIPKGNIKPLTGYKDGRKRLRIGKYRIVFTTKGEALHIIEIGARGDIYK